MIKNVNNKEELNTNKDKVRVLDEIFRLAVLIINHNEAEFELELEKGYRKMLLI